VSAFELSIPKARVCFPLKEGVLWHVLINNKINHTKKCVQILMKSKNPYVIKLMHNFVYSGYLACLVRLASNKALFALIFFNKRNNKELK
jgi:hypothetical protein